MATRITPKRKPVKILDKRKEKDFIELDIPELNMTVQVTGGKNPETVRRKYMVAHFRKLCPKNLTDAQVWDRYGSK